MKTPKLIGSVLLLMIFAAVTVAQSKKKMNSYLGKSKNELIKGFGMPLIDNKQDTTMEIIAFGTHTVLPRSIYYPDGINLWEYNVFFLEGGIVTAWRKQNESIPPERVDVSLWVNFVKP